MDGAFKEKCRARMIRRWKDPAYRVAQSQMSTEMNKDPARRQAASERMANWAAAHPEHFTKLAESNRAWAAAHPDKKLAAARAGHKALVVKGKRSSIEIELEQALVAKGLPFQAEWEHALGVADFLVAGKVVVFADGDYWHRKPGAQKKDKKHNAHLSGLGYKVLRFWETDINSDSVACAEQVRLAVESCRKDEIDPNADTGTKVRVQG